MALVAGMIVPHPPIIIPEIGQDRLAEAEATVSGMRRLAEDIAKTDTDVLVSISPHSPMLYDSFLIKSKSRLSGSFSLFGFPDLEFIINGDEELPRAIITACAGAGVPMTKVGERTLFVDNHLDHGILVPYFYLSQKQDYSLVSISISSLPLDKHFALGEVIGDICARDSRKIAFMASGDLSHRLSVDAPAGYLPRGAEFDKTICDIVTAGDLKKLLDISDDLIEAAGECGLRSLTTLAGVISGQEYEIKLLSYEGPFGVGYMVAEALIK